MTQKELMLFVKEYLDEIIENAQDKDGIILSYGTAIDCFVNEIKSPERD